jgi:hypothetical protein
LTEYNGDTQRRIATALERILEELRLLRQDMKDRNPGTVAETRAKDDLLNRLG